MEKEKRIQREEHVKTRTLCKTRVRNPAGRLPQEGQQMRPLREVWVRLRIIGKAGLEIWWALIGDVEGAF